jgi:hypothetical protein
LVPGATGIRQHEFPAARKGLISQGKIANAASARHNARPGSPGLLLSSTQDPPWFGAQAF